MNISLRSEDLLAESPHLSIAPRAISLPTPPSMLFKALLCVVVASATAFHAIPVPLGQPVGVAVGRSSVRRVEDLLMAVPKKRQSKMKTRQRKANWFAKAKRQATLAWSRGMSAKYNPLEDPKYALSPLADDEDDDEE
ncbi:hypothetical protein AB1Y20_014159 [Prymnesium parvum]|uniref:Uncharacterized protein n=1 Tax=Prymnesium parvum TaxID=97485 RepID=A0AB34IFF9_PRYPA